MGLVDNNRIVRAQLSVASGLGQENAVGHELDPGCRSGPVGEPDFATDQPGSLQAQFLGHPTGNRGGRQTAGLGAADHSFTTAARIKAHLGQLRGLAGTGITGNDHHPMVANRLDNFPATCRDGKFFRIFNL